MVPVVVRVYGTTGTDAEAAGSEEMIWTEPVGVTSPTAASVEMIGMDCVVVDTTVSGSASTPVDSGSSMAMMDTALVAGARRRPRRTTRMVPSASGMLITLGAATHRELLSTPNRPHST